MKGAVLNSRILAGADLGDDWRLGGADGNADTFVAGDIERLSIGGDVTDSVIGAGLVPTPGGQLDLAWLAASSSFIHDCTIGSLKVGGALTSNAGSGMPFGIGAYAISKARLGTGSDPALLVSEA